MPGKAGKKKTLRKPKLVLSMEEFQLNQIRQKILDFLSLKDTKRIAIISDNDQDGVTSAVQVKKFLDLKRVKSKVFFYDHYSKDLSVPQKEFFSFNAEKTIFLDMNEGFISDILQRVGKATGPFLVIDHHQGEVIRNNSFRCLVIKPKNFSTIQPSRYPVTKMVYDIFGGTDWICAIGVIGDFAFEQWADFLRKTEKKHKLSFSKFKELDDVVACVTSQYPEKINSLFEFLCESKGPKGLLSSDYFALKKLFDQKLDILNKRFYKEAECFTDTQICFFHCDPRFSSKLSNIISNENQHKVIVIFEQPGAMMKCSIRRQDFLVNCSELAKAGIAGTPEGKGGGHVPAAGAHFSVSYFDEFKKRVRMYLLENPPKQAK